LKELYCALTGVNLPPGAQVIVNTLRNVLFLGPINDISFEVAGKLVVLIEHQSTINPNMALRLLLYLAKMYERAVFDRNLYGTKLVRIPRPEFWVLYNGTAPYPERQTLRLSDAFEEVTSLGVLGKAALELEVEVININEGQNEGIVKRCKTLAQYSAFIDRVRICTQEMGDREGAMRAAIKYCREHDILGEFLGNHGTEVINMLLDEYTVEDAIELMRKESLREGREEGREKGREEGLGLAAKNMFGRGMSPDWIAETLNLPLDTVRLYLD
jgi:hypothetical protein